MAQASADEKFQGENMRLRINTVPGLDRYVRTSRMVVAYLVGLVLLLAFSAGNAWSFYPAGASLPHKNIGVSYKQDMSPHQGEAVKVPSSTKADQCLPLLKPFQPTSESALDRNQRTAGQIAALGLLFGIRLAPGPLERPGKDYAETMVRIKVSPDADDGGRSALAVTMYRQCRKQDALKSLSRDLRWSR